MTNPIAVADEIVEVLTAHNFGIQDLTYKRVWVERIDPATNAAKTPKAFVIATSAENSRLTRAGRKEGYTVQIVFVCRVDSVDVETVDPLVLMTLAAGELFEGKRLSDTKVVENGVKITPFDYDKLKNERLYMSMVELTLEGMR